MRKYVFIALTLLVGLSFHDRTHAQTIDPLRQGHALLIGNSRYRDSGWPRLDDIPLQLSALKKGLESHFETVEIVQNLETEPTPAKD